MFNTWRIRGGVPHTWWIWGGVAHLVDLGWCSTLGGFGVVFHTWWIWGGVQNRKQCVVLLILSVFVCSDWSVFLQVKVFYCFSLKKKNDVFYFHVFTNLVVGMFSHVQDFYIYEY